MRRSGPLSLLLSICLLLPLTAIPAPVPVAQGQPRTVRLKTEKLHAELAARARHTRAGSGERARVILNITDETSRKQSRAALQRAGASIGKQLDALNVIVADVPVDKLSEVSEAVGVTWISPDQEVRSLATSTDNTSHLEVTTGASKVLPSSVINGGAGNGVGIAILDSGISPPETKTLKVGALSRIFVPHRAREFEQFRETQYPIGRNHPL